ncbi:MAG TPA: ABC transporter transmembrane domain-containing protein, partial [Novimethylophilus sp.]|uniref:ABC transporter transmembrane domain-containing protein n=1 Tax=Novimethylophilus sp. TaxID=2137426 RepID=UPI002F424452
MSNQNNITQERPKSKNIRQLARIAGFLGPYRRQIVTASAALVVASASILALGQGLKIVIDHGLSAGSTALLDQALVGMLAVIAVMAAATFTRFYYVSWIGERVTADIRRAVFGHLLELSPGFFETARTGEVISRLTSDTTVLESAIGSSISMALRNFLNMLGALVMLFVTSAKLTALVLLGVPLVIVPILLFGKRVRKLSRASQDRVADVGAYIDEALHEIRTVQAYGHESQDRYLFGERVEQVFATSVRRIRQRASLMAAVILLVFGAIGFILWVGGHDV